MRKLLIVLYVESMLHRLYAANNSPKMKYGNNIHIYYPLFSSRAGLLMKMHDGERTFNIYSRRAYRLNHIFLIQPGKLRKQNFFFVSAYTGVYQFSINTKVSRW